MYEKQFTNQFYGDNHRFFIGIVERGSAEDPSGLRRVKVRVAGLHTSDRSKIDTDDLPWSQVMLPGDEPGMGGLGNGPNIEPGAQVFGIFLDGKTSQIPFVLGSMPRFEGMENSARIPMNGDNTYSGNYVYNPDNPRRSGDVPPANPTYIGNGYPPDMPQVEIERIIVEEANLRNIEPSIPVRYYRREGLGHYRSQVPVNYGDGLEPSYGPFQLFIGGGLGNQYQNDTGHYLPTDNTRDGIITQIRYCLDYAAANDWKPWDASHLPPGASHGLGRYDGLENASPVWNWK